MAKPRAFIQWKGTDVCLDFTCECGFSGHFDGYFAYYLGCPECLKVYKTPEVLKLTQVERGDLVVSEVEGGEM